MARIKSVNAKRITGRTTEGTFYDDPNSGETTFSHITTTNLADSVDEFQRLNVQQFKENAKGELIEGKRPKPKQYYQGSFFPEERTSQEKEITVPDDVRQKRIEDTFETFHATDADRDSIAKKGLKTTEVDHGGEDEDGNEVNHVLRGVWSSPSPEKGYGDDIYGIRNVKEREPRTFAEELGSSTNHMRYPRDMDSVGYDYYTKSIRTSDVKRVGHFGYNPDTGATEVHWHKEEDCPNG
jgi:hypothetical protein